MEKGIEMSSRTELGREIRNFYLKEAQAKYQQQLHDFEALDAKLRDAVTVSSALVAVVATSVGTAISIISSGNAFRPIPPLSAQLIAGAAGAYIVQWILFISGTAPSQYKTLAPNNWSDIENQISSYELRVADKGENAVSEEFWNSVVMTLLDVIKDNQSIAKRKRSLFIWANILLGVMIALLAFAALVIWSSNQQLTQP